MDVVRKVYRDFYLQYENEYVYSSRAAMRHLNIQDYPMEFYKTYFSNHSFGGNLSISQVLKESQLNLLKKYLYECGLEENMNFDVAAYNKMYPVFIQHLDEITACFSDEINGAKQYFTGLLHGHKRICVADLGWNGTIMVELSRFFRHYFPEVELKFILFGAAKAQTTTDLQSGSDLFAFAFSELHDKGLEIDSGTFEGNTSIMCLESMFSADSTSMTSYGLGPDGKALLKFGVKTEQAWMVEAIQDGIRFFASKYCELVGKLNKPLYISAEDAFRPYSSIADDYQYLYLLFNQVKEYEDGSVVSGSTKRLTTIGNIMEARNLI